MVSAHIAAYLLFQRNDIPPFFLYVPHPTVHIAKLPSIVIVSLLSAASLCHSIYSLHCTCALNCNCILSVLCPFLLYVFCPCNFASIFLFALDLYLLCHKIYKASGLSFSGMLIFHVFSNLPSGFGRRPSATTLALALLSMRLQMIRQEMSKLGFSTKMNTVAFNRLWFDSLADQCFTELSLMWGYIYNLH